MNLTTQQTEWLYALQRPWPLVERPLALLATQLKTTEATLLAFIQDLRKAGLVRRVGGVFDARRLGYRSCLFGIHATTEAALKEAVDAVVAQPGVTHAYLRGWPTDFQVPGISAADYAEYPNLWYTLSAPAATYDEAAQPLARFNPHPFPALTRYKIDVVFDLRTRNRDEKTEYLSPSNIINTTPITAEQQALVRRYQDDVCDEAAPFRLEDLPQLTAWQADGTLRRFGLLLYHRATGFTANGMCCWQVAPEVIDTYGRRLAAQPEVTHCYARPAQPGFPFTLYAMIHKTSWHEAMSTFEQLTHVAELTHHPRKIFFSTQEYKKSSLRFFI